MTILPQGKINKGFIIAIDGPVASGKGTIARLLSEALDGFYIDTGAMYRSLALFCVQNKILFTDTKTIISHLSDVIVDLAEHKTFLNGVDVSKLIRKHEISAGASPVSVIPEVREKFAEYQLLIAEQKIVEGKIVIAEGRDTGTHVFQHAAMKIYLIADIDIRAHRRLKQLQERGEQITLTEVVKSMQDRDLRDSSRAVAPLTLEPEKHGYFILDNSALTEDQTIAMIMSELTNRKLIDNQVA